MDKLPLEILTQIASHLPFEKTVSRKRPNGKKRKGKRKSYPTGRTAFACLSRKTQLAVETLVFRDIEIARGDLEEFENAFADNKALSQHRRALLKKLKFRLTLVHDLDCPINEAKDHEIATRDIAYGNFAVISLFDVLVSWQGSATVGFDLVIEAVSVNDDFKPRPQNELTQPRIELRTAYLSLYDQIFEGKPALSCVRSVTFARNELRFQPSAALAVVVQAGSGQGAPLERADWGYKEPTAFPRLVRRIRRDFAQSLQTLRLPPSLRSLKLHMETGWYNHDESVPDFTSPDPPGRDPLCVGLHRLIADSNLEVFDYAGPVDASLFLPPPDAAKATSSSTSTADEPPIFRSLTNLRVHMFEASPSGRRYFRPAQPRPDNDNVGDEPLPQTHPVWKQAPPYFYTNADDIVAAMEHWGEFHRKDLTKRDRTVPNDELMLPLLSAFARALARMPALKVARLESKIGPPETKSQDSPDRTWSVDYVAPWQQYEYEAGRGEPLDLSAPRAYFNVAGGWRPSEEVLQLFRDIGKKRHGRETVVKFAEAEHKHPFGHVDLNAVGGMSSRDRAALFREVLAGSMNAPQDRRRERGLLTDRLRFYT